ncbi:MAG: DUF1566 domain-containing protein, partial [Oceanicoccus sp.]|uniref:hypothetical protein n=1 Tax=Oceanicoccus sp. TaxID=2691044 RepID=UPI002630EA41
INMKKLRALFLALAMIATYSISAQVSINTDDSDPDGSAMLDVKSTDKGFLPPRMTETQRQTISSPATGLIIYNTTQNQPNYFNGTEWMNYDGTSALAIGDFYQGGVVFYLDGSGGVLVCAVSDQDGGSGTPWGCPGTPISGADGTAIGTGAQNTIDILAGCSTVGIAAYICDTLTLNDYTDWFLPSKDELYEMYLNKAAIDATAIINGGVALKKNENYWSSSEVDNDKARRQDYTNGASTP